jgi:mono/diheme cytochrome c family protein
MVVSLAGLRGCVSRQPPLEIYSDMKRQPKLRPQTANPFFADQMSSRLPVPGTIPRGAPYADAPVNTGRRLGATNWLETGPLPVTAQLLTRGQERYLIFCAPCHSPVGDGNGINIRYGMIRAANYHDRRLVRMADGEIFNTLSNGKNLMAAYGSQVAIADRWAIVAYIRALQRSRLGTLEDVPGQFMSSIK